MKTYIEQKIEFEKRAFNANRELLLYFMGATNVVSTDYGRAENKVIDYLGIDKVFENGSRRKTASLRIRQKDWGNITIRGHISDPYSQTRKLYDIYHSGTSYADWTVQINGLDADSLKANGTIICLSNRLLSTYLNALQADDLLERHFRDFGNGARFYEFTYQDLRRGLVVPRIETVNRFAFV